jgi:hypothetical protein
MKAQILAIGILGAMLAAGAVNAQGPGGGPGGPSAGQGGFGGGQGGQGGFGGGQGGQGGFGGGQGGFGGGRGGFQRPPMEIGTVSAVDATGDTITISTPTGDSETIKVPASAQIVTQQTISVSDLAVGDTVSIQGIPTGLTAIQLTDGQPPAGLIPQGRGRGGFGGGGQGGGGGFGGGANAAGGGGPGGTQNQDSVRVSGTIATLPTSGNPQLGITLSSSATLLVTVSSDTKVNKFVSLGLSDIKTGDTIIAGGQERDDGTFRATSIGVNLPIPAGRGGFGRGQGGFGGGQGGGGGFGGGPGGQGGQGGQGAPPPPDPSGSDNT